MQLFGLRVALEPAPVASGSQKTALKAGPFKEKTKGMRMRAQRVSKYRRKKVSTAARDRIVLDHLPLVKAIAVRVHGNLPVHVDLDDLIHAGVLGLFDAATKYNPEKKV